MTYVDERTLIQNAPRYDADSAERALLLLLECCDGIMCKLGPGDDDSTHVSLNITCKRRDLDLPFAFDVFRLVDKLIYDIDLHLVGIELLEIYFLFDWIF